MEYWWMYHNTYSVVYWINSSKFLNCFKLTYIVHTYIRHFTSVKVLVKTKVLQLNLLEVYFPTPMKIFFSTVNYYGMTVAHECFGLKRIGACYKMVAYHNRILRDIHMDQFFGVQEVQTTDNWFNVGIQGLCFFFWVN